MKALTSNNSHYEDSEKNHNSLSSYSQPLDYTTPTNGDNMHNIDETELRQLTLGILCVMFIVMSLFGQSEANGTVTMDTENATYQWIPQGE
jgi:hypothetical protein